MPKLFTALISLLVLVGALTMAGVAPAGAAPDDRWIDLNWSCCGDQQSAVFMGGAWASGMPVTLEIDHGNNGSIDATQTGTTPIVNNFFAVTPILAPGDRVIVTSDGVTKETVVANLFVEYVNPETNVVQGRSTPGSTVDVTANPGPGSVTLPATADGFGHWSIDFTGLFDIQEHDPSGPATQDELVSARLVETGPGADGDATSDGRSADLAMITVTPNCCGDQAIVQNSSQGWRVGTQLTLDVDRGNNGSIDFTKTITYVGFPQLTATNDLSPLSVGDKVTVSGAGWVKVLVVVPLSITGVDAATNVVTGTATFGDHVVVDIIDPGVPGPNPATRSVDVTDPGGDWSIDFSPYDVTLTQQAQAFVSDTDQDRTVALFVPTPPSAWLTLSPDTGLVNGQSISLTGANWPAGKTLYVTECRLDQGLSSSSCDANTTQQFTVGGTGTVSGNYIVTRHITPSSGNYDCLVSPGCGLVGVVWPGTPNVGFPQALDSPNNNVIAFADLGIVGDANCDGTLNPNDALRVLRLIVGLELLTADCNAEHADVDHSGSVDIRDALFIRRSIAGLPNTELAAFDQASTEREAAPDRVHSFARRRLGQ